MNHVTSTNISCRTLKHTDTDTQTHRHTDTQTYMPSEVHIRNIHPIMTHKRIMAHIRMSHVEHMSESCRTQDTHEQTHRHTDTQTHLE